MASPFSASLPLVTALLFLLGQPVAEAQQKKANPLRTIGALSGAHVYTTYGYIGAVADAFGKGAYDAKRVELLMSEVMGMADVSVGELQAIRDSSLAEDDKKVVQDIIEVYQLLRGEADALTKYAKTRKKEDLNAFNEVRRNVWPRIEKLLRLPGNAKTEAGN